MDQVSLARLVYETKRSLQGRQYQVEKRRGSRGNFKSAYTGTPRGVRGTQKIGKSSRQRRREGGETGKQSLAEEIEGSGILGLIESADARERARKRLEELGWGTSVGVSSLDAAGKRAIQKART